MYTVQYTERNTIFVRISKNNRKYFRCGKCRYNTTLFSLIKKHVKKMHK